MDIVDKKVRRLILKEDDILVIKVPHVWFGNRNAIKSLYAQIKKQLLPKKNKVLVLPNDVDISVIGETEIKEYITNIDLWELFDE
jgi:hypothetical protein